MTCGWTECRARPMDFWVKTNKSVTTCFEALITTRPSSAVFFDLASIRSSSAISNRQISNSDWRKTFTNSLEMVSRFFSRKPLHEYSTVSEKCRTMNAESQIITKFIPLCLLYSHKSVYSHAVPKRVFPKCLYLAHFSFNLPTHDASEPRGIYKLISILNLSHVNVDDGILTLHSSSSKSSTPNLDSMSSIHG